MNDKINELLVKYEILLKNFRTIETGNFTKKRSLSIFFGVDLSQFRTLLYLRDAKSRFVSKDAISLIEIDKKVQSSENKIVKKKILFLSSALCSKAAKILNENGFMIYDFV